MTESILCFIDFSETSAKTLEWTVNMALTLHAHVTIVHPYRLNNSNLKADMVLVNKRIVLEAAENFDKITPRLLKEKAVTYDFRSEVGFLNDRVLEHTKKNKTRLLVMGSNLASGNMEMLKALMEDLSVPLVIIPPIKPI